MSEDWDQARTIQASEIAEYIACHRQWWLRRVQGVLPIETGRMAFGRDAHDAHNRLLARAARNERWIFLLVTAAVALAVFALFLWLFG